MVYRVYVERRAGFDAEAKSLLSDLNGGLGLALTGVRVLNRYDVEGIDESTFEKAKRTVLSEPQSDILLASVSPADGDTVLISEYLPGQFDQRADSCAQCIQLLSGGERPAVRTAKVYVFSGPLSAEDLAKVKSFLINPVESRECGDEARDTLALDAPVPDDVAVLDGFRDMDDDGIRAFLAQYALAMDEDDLRFTRDTFREEGRDPSLTEIRLLDTYWSDHCRHTTFGTQIDSVELPERLRGAYDRYLQARETVYGERAKTRPMSLMDLATVGMKLLRKTGQLKNLDESEEINACTVKIRANIDGRDEDWLLLFKNETHNHPTEIEPFGGAATCLGGCIRDPLSGRAYVCQAMRVTGAGDPRKTIAETLPGKLPQSRLTRGAAAGYSSYGNQIGLATGGVYEIYHPGYVAKRLEIGAVVGAVKADAVVREEPLPGDKVILLGGRTGRDGCGGATGSSKSHTAQSLTTCGAEVQKGNPPEERKIQRLFRDPAVTVMIKRCNDFGAGGVSVAVGELADGLSIDLDRVPKKYDGLDGTELAISESQERMAVVVAPENAEAFIAAAEKENLEATVIADVTKEKRMVMRWRGRTIVDLPRSFLSSNGAPKHTGVAVAESGKTDRGVEAALAAKDTRAAFEAALSDLNVCSQKGLSERFDSTIGAGTVVMPFGGKNQLTPPQYMAAKIPVLRGDCRTASFMAYGYDPAISESDPYQGAQAAILESVARLVTAGIPYQDSYLTLQEYFPRTKGDPQRWGLPFSALLGALDAQLGLGIASVGGKDSMSGTFEDLDVPPTLVSFAVAAADRGVAVTPEFKAVGDKVWYLEAPAPVGGRYDYAAVTALFDKVHALCAAGKARAVMTPGRGGLGAALHAMAAGNGVGFTAAEKLPIEKLFARTVASFVVETAADVEIEGAELIGHTTGSEALILNGSTLPLNELNAVWKKPLEGVFPLEPAKKSGSLLPVADCTARPRFTSPVKFAKPRVVIPVFPGTNCEYDTARAFESAGAVPTIHVIRNLTPDALADSLRELAALLDDSQILMLPGGFSGGDEPDGSGKFITAVLRSPAVREAVTRLLDDRRGLALGICNGFQALVKSGLLPYGRILDEMPEDAPTLTYNDIGRHQSMLVRTRIASTDSPWLAGVNVGDVHTIPISHGEGRFTAPREVLEKLIAAGRVATQYVDRNGRPTMDVAYNPNGADAAIEGILSPDGRILGKMGHSERTGRGLYVNVGGSWDQKLFVSGVKYFA